MQVQRIHDERHPVTSLNGPHVPAPGTKPGDAESSRQPTAKEELPLAFPLESKFLDLLKKLRQLPDHDAEIVRLAKARFESGELLTREVAESLATSLLNEFVS